MAGDYRGKPPRGARSRGAKTHVDPSSHHRGKLPYATHAGDGVVVNGYSERWLRQGFPWVYKDEIVARTGGLIQGSVVSIRDRNGVVLGTGIWDEGKVEVRRFRTDEGPIDADLIRDRIVSARSRRPIGPDTTAWRWVHGENDGLPGVRVDVWGKHLGVALDSPSLSGLLDPLLEVLTDVADVDGVWLSWRPGAGAPSQFDGLPKGQVWGQRPPGDVLVTERGLKALVQPWAGHDAGLFCDMRGLRAWMEPHWRGRRVLNTFAHTGMFSVAAAAHGAYEVVTVDLSDTYLARARANFRANDLDPEMHQFLAQDTFKALDACRRAGDRFDVVIADPPSFSHGPAGDWSVERDLGRLVASCLRVLEPGGWLLLASNHGGLSPKEFQKHLLAGSRKAKRPLRLLHQGSTPLDFPASLDFPESRYLKAWVLQA